MAIFASSVSTLLAAQRFIDRTPVVILIFLSGFAVVVYLIYRLNKFVEGRRVRGEEKRSHAIAAAMSGQGLTLTQSKSLAHAALLQSFVSGQRGDTRTVWNLLESAAGAAPAIRMMDYSFVIYNGQRRVVRGHTVALIDQPGLALPSFYLTKEEIFQWAEKLLKVQDIDFPEYPKFSKMYHLRGEDEPAIRALFQSTILSALEQHPGLTIEGTGSQLLIFREGDVLDPGKWPAFLDEARQLAQLFAG